MKNKTKIHTAAFASARLHPHVYSILSHFKSRFQVIFLQNYCHASTEDAHNTNIDISEPQRGEKMFC